MKRGKRPGLHGSQLRPGSFQNLAPDVLAPGRVECAQNFKRLLRGKALAAAPLSKTLRAVQAFGVVRSCFEVGTAALSHLLPRALLT
jgi:hypothetical protein